MSNANNYRRNHQATRNEILRSDGVVDLVNERAESAVEYLKAEAQHFRRSGDYIESITHYPRTRAGDRYGAIVTATAPYAHYIEARHHVFSGVVDYIENL